MSSQVFFRHFVWRNLRLLWSLFAWSTINLFTISLEHMPRFSYNRWTILFPDHISKWSLLICWAWYLLGMSDSGDTLSYLLDLNLYDRILKILPLFIDLCVQNTHWFWFPIMKNLIFEWVDIMCDLFFSLMIHLFKVCQLISKTYFTLFLLLRMLLWQLSCSQLWDERWSILSFMLVNETKALLLSLPLVFWVYCFIHETKW